MINSPHSFAYKALLELQSNAVGAVLIADDPMYDAVRMAWNLAVDQHPAVIVVATGVDDVISAVNFAKEAHLSIAVQSTGHGVILPANDCLLIITSKMNKVEIDVQEQTAYVTAGTQWSKVLELAQMDGLAPLLGSAPHVGVIGYTLGGGMGWLARQYGLALDSVIEFDLVTPDGQFVVASESENSDLFWGLRGGGGNFGVVTAIKIKLYPVTTVYGGNLYYPVSQAKEVYQRYREWIKTAPTELTSAVTLMNYPPIPALPPILSGQSYVQIRGCFCGTVEDGESLMAYWRDWQTPVIDDFKVMPFSQVGKISNDPVDPIPGLSSGAWLADLSDEAIDLIIEAVVPNGKPPVLVFLEVRHAGGAIEFAKSGSTAYSHRHESLSMQMIAVTPDQDIRRMAEAYISAFKARLAPHLTGNVYMNFLEGEEARQSARKAFNQLSHEKLQALKAKIDPENRFNHSINIAKS